MPPPKSLHGVTGLVDAFDDLLRGLALHVHLDRGAHPWVPIHFAPLSSRLVSVPLLTSSPAGPATIFKVSPPRIQTAL